MDPNRREVYVEGPSDRMFLLYLAGDARNSNVVVQDVNAVDLAPVPGGAKGKLMTLAGAVAGEERILCFADADFDRLLGRVPPDNVVLTDGNDVEAYFLTERCLHKVIAFGLSRERPGARGLLETVLKACRSVGLLRFVSLRDELSLSVDSVSLASATKVRNLAISFDFVRFATAVINRSAGGSQLADIQARIADASERLVGLADLEMVRGHDAVALIAELLVKWNVRREDVGPMLRAAFDVGTVESYESLGRVLGFIAQAQPITATRPNG